MTEPLLQYRLRDNVFPVRYEQKLYEDEHRTYITPQRVGSTLTYAAYSWFELRIIKRPTKEAAEKRVNLKYIRPLHDRHMDSNSRLSCSTPPSYL